MFKLILLIPILVTLGACSSTEQIRATTIAINKCPTLKNYSREQLVRAAQELRSLPSESQLSVMLSDYSKLRDACRIAEQRLRQMNKQ
jgi:uncharacterized lipoprotein YbaY